MSRIIIFRNVQRNVLRTVLTVVGIAVGVSAVVGLLSISMGLRNTIDEQVSKLGQNFMMVVPGGEGFGASIAFKTFDESVLEDILRVPGVESASGRYTASATLEYKNELRGVRIGGVTSEDLEEIIEQNVISLDQGQIFTDSYGIVLGRNIWRDLDEPGIGESVEIEGEKFKVRGVLESVGAPGFNSVVIMPLEKAWEFAGVDDEYTIILIFVSDPSVADAIERELERSFEEEDEFTLLTNEKLVEQAGQLLGVVDGFLIGITGVSVIVGVLGIANTMFVSVTERINEIGVMKTVGATDLQVASIIVQESAVIGLVGGIVGVIFGILLGQGIELVASWYEVSINSYVPFEMMVVTIFATIILGMLSGLLPAWEASKLDPVEALNI